MILIVSHGKDAHTRRVMDLLAQRGHPNELLDLSWFPVNSSLSIAYEPSYHASSSLTHGTTVIDLHECRAAWWRRPQCFTLHNEVRGPIESSFSLSECQCAISGMWLLEPTRWINHPVRDEVANRKVYQLKVAADCGLTIPKTLVTNDMAKARDFVAELKLGNVIFKSFSATQQAWRETRLIKEEELAKIETVKYAPVIFQECIHASIDLRITIVGDKVFPAAIHSQETSYKVDYRMNYEEAKIECHDLPAAVISRLKKLMDKLGLVYGAIDMRKNEKGEYIFLEVNTAGQWLFMEEPTGLPITEAIADKLMQMDESSSSRDTLSLTSQQADFNHQVSPLASKMTV